MKKLAPRTARLAGAGAAAFVLALAAPAAAQADDKLSCTSKSASGLGSHTFTTAGSCSPAETLTITSLDWNEGLGTATEDDASVTVTGLPGLTGDLVVTANVENEKGEQAAWIITVTLFDEPEAPEANNDSFSLKAGETKSGNVKSNDGSGDAPADDWDVFLVSEPTKGELKLSADGSFTYEANTDASGADTFSYKLEKDGESSNTATVSINITAAGGGGGDDDDDDNNGGDNNNGDNNNGGNTGKDTNADKDKLAKTGMSLPTVAVTGAGALGAGAVALWFTRRRKESGSTI